ncbi:MAG: proteasome accessory factor PafA2 family protein, partial [Candidatus Nanopelagicales bacterium]
PFNKIISVLTTFFVTRQIFTGAGRLGVGVNEIDFEYQISQRADFFETLVGLETTMRRPIINTRDEPHADPNLYRRLHVIIGDANMSDVANLLKIGTTSLVLKLLEDSDLDDFELELDAPLEALKMVSQDLELKKKLKLKNGKYLTAIEIQYVFLERVQHHLEKIDEIDPDTQETLNWWQEILDLLREDIFLTVNYLDWVAKLNLIQNIKSRDNLKWSDSVLQMLDLQYADLNPNRSLARLLERKGSLKRLVGDAEIIAAVKFPPISTRAWFRGQSLLRFSNQIAGASWDSVIFDISADRPLLRIPTLDPLKGNQEQLGDIFESAKSAADLVMRLSHS